MTLPAIDETTRSAHWGWDEHRYFGHRVFAELAGTESITGLLALSILGRRLPPEDCGVLDDAAGALTLADPRIWPLKLTRVVASYGAMIPALAAGTLMENHARIGPWAARESARVLAELHQAIGAFAGDPARVEGVVKAHIRERRFVWGFGTPFRDKDERLVAFRTYMHARGRDELPHWRTMDAVATALKGARDSEPNMGMALAAVMLDMGFTADEVGAMVVGLMQHMFFAHAIEGANTTSVLLQLPDQYVDYRGRKPRVSPRAQGTRV